MNQKLIITGGRARKHVEKQPEWEQYDRGVIAELDLVTGRLDAKVEYETPAEFRPDGQSAVLFKSGHLADQALTVCTQTEILTFNTSNFEQTGHFSHPLMNDVHHVLTDAKHYWVVSTGLDMVLQFDHNHQLLHTHYVQDGDPWQRFDQNKDYRKVLTTKPHLSHPNFIFAYQDSHWVTRFEQRDVLSLANPSENIATNIERPHDGVVVNNDVYFTTVNGFIVKASLTQLKILEVINLNKIVNKNYALGWCRGLLIRDNIALVGFSKLRSTKFKDNLRWLRHRVGLNEHAGTQPSRIAAFDLTQLKLLWEVPLELTNIDAVFSVLASDAVTADQLSSFTPQAD